MKFKIGDRIRSKKSASGGYACFEKNWEGKVTGYRTTLCSSLVEVVTIKSEDPKKIGQLFYVFPKYFELIEDENKVELHVTTKGRVTTAVKKVNGKVVARAEAKCSPKDEYDADKGIRIALAKLELQEAMK